MSNNNDNEQISSNVSSNSGPSSSVESFINVNIINLEISDANKTSTNGSISKTVAASKPCENSSSNQANTVYLNEEPNSSTNHNAGTSSGNPFNEETSGTIENINLISTATSEDEHNKNVAIPQGKYLSTTQSGIVNEGNGSEGASSVNNVQNQIGVLLPFPQTSLPNSDSGVSQEQLNQVTPSQLFENLLTLAGRSPKENNDKVNGSNVINTNDRSINICTPNIIESNETVSELQVTTSIYLSNNPSGLPYQPLATQNQSTAPQPTERRHRPERFRQLPASFSETLFSPRCSREFSDSTNLTSYRTIVPAHELRVVPVPAASNIGVSITPPPVPPRVIHGPPPIAGAPPTYSAVMRLGPEDQRQLLTHSIRIQPSPPFIAPIPPPPYTEIQGIHTERPMLVASADQMIWGPDPISVVCPRCANVVVTSTQSQRSNLTHFSALALCLCGCWPCCLLPYCMDSCKNTYHHCPTCQQFLGMYRPW